jgi:hypothetical protein
MANTSRPLRPLNDRCEIWGSHGDENVDVFVLACDIGGTVGRN